MYKKILIALENGPADATIIPHVAELAGHFGSEILLLHVADGFAARCFDQLKLAESEEIKEDRIYLEKVAGKLRAKKLSVSTLLAMGDPPAEILKIAAEEKCDLIAMTSHGHRFFGDLFHGSTITQVRHNTHIPLLVLRAKKI
ncbi:MAG TPA: universal stress protein [Verrucomicrobiae bacterium]